MTKAGSSGLIQNAFGFLERSQEITSLKELTAEFAAQIRAFGFTHFLCAGVTGPGGEPCPETFFGVPNRHWQARYLERDYHLRDAVMRIGLRAAMPFSWDEARSDPSVSDAERVLDPAP